MRRLNDHEKMAHLLRRAGLSASRAEIEHYLPMGIEGATNRLLNYHEQPEEFNDEEIIKTLQQDRPRPEPQHAMGWWIYRLLTTTRPFQERIALFWHDHFATSSSKVRNGLYLQMQIQLFQRLGTGNFQELVLQVSRDPAMMVWLDGIANLKGKPNENYARELLELFTMGIGNYTEQDIAEAARAFTGWTIRRINGAFYFNESQHDKGEKLFLGQRGPWTGEDVIRMAVEYPATATFISAKVYEAFINDTAPPDKKVVAALARTFTESGYNILALIKRALTSDTFWSERSIRRRVKSPSEFVIGAMRQMGLGERLREAGLQTSAGMRLSQAIIRMAASYMDRMGQTLLRPPSVKGWDSGTAWINSATMLERMRFADAITQGPAQLGQRARQAQTLRSLLQTEARNLTSQDDFIDRLQLSLDVELQRSTREKLSAYLQAKGGMTAIESQDRAVISGALKILFSSSEYQLI